MAKSMPSMVALLGLLAVAGYQNRDKLSDLVADARRNAEGATGPNTAGHPAGHSPGHSGAGTTGLSGMLAEIGSIFKGPSGGGSLAEGLRDLVGRFQQAGKPELSDSWVRSGPNLTLRADDVEAALGEDVLRDLTAKTGLSRAELLQRVSNALPQMVDRFTPKGHLPSPDEARTLL